MQIQRSVNTALDSSVERRVCGSRLIITTATVILPLLMTSGCVQVDGGAVELSWSLLTFDGQPIVGDDCLGANIDRVRLNWDENPELEDRNHGFTDFECTAYRGITDFVITVEDPATQPPYLLWIEPVCANNLVSPAGTFEVPAPISRNMREGEVVTLNSLLIVTAVDQLQGTVEHPCECPGDPSSPEPTCTCCFDILEEN